LAGGQVDVDEDLREQLAKLLVAISRLEQVGDGDSKSVPPEALLTAANGLMAAHRWADSARYFDAYVARNASNWEAQYLRGVAHANIRGGFTSDLSSLRAYNEAIALAPTTTDQNTMARLFAYRGAIAKRLNRLDQAEYDLLLAKTKATANYELADIAYNLACVYAMTNRKQETLVQLRALRNLGKVDLVQAHLDDYFHTLRNDVDFRREAGL
jgi:tetratricopeptide (TPR) repeat protein